jgi:hypothetical protein
MDDHEAMDGLADRLIHLARPGMASAEQCHLMLCSFKCQLTAHRAAEASFLAEHDGNGTSDAFDAEWTALEDAFSELSDGWKAYLGRWTVAAIETDRAAFAQETGDLMTVFKLRIARENSITYPLALETGRILLHAP